MKGPHWWKAGRKKVMRPCRYCGDRLSFLEMRGHASRCERNPLTTVCRYCGERISLRKGVGPHSESCKAIPPIPEGMKLCSQCQDIRPVGMFSINQWVADGRHRICKICHRIQNQERGKMPETKTKKHADHVRGLYGITMEQYGRLLQDQGGLCAICKTAPDPDGTKNRRRLQVDHCHRTGAIRGLLCSKCNLMIGHSCDNPAVLFAGGEYLMRQLPIKKVS